MLFYRKYIFLINNDFAAITIQEYCAYDDLKRQINYITLCIIFQIKFDFSSNKLHSFQKEA